MLGWLARKRRLRRIGQEVYEGIVAAARNEVFFRDMRVPDTMDGRFEMIVLHMHLVLERLKREGEPGQQLGQVILERLIADLDDALRQIGIGDMGVPRRVQRAAAAVRERVVDYGGEVAPTGDRLELAIARHVYGADGDRPDDQLMRQVGRLASYVRASRSALEAQRLDELAAGTPAFAHPA